MIDSGYYAAVVKEEIETDDEKVGRPKIISLEPDQSVQPMRRSRIIWNLHLTYGESIL